MKKAIIFTIALLMCMTLVLASSPPIPMPVAFRFIHNGKPIENFEVSLKVNSEVVRRTTNELGMIVVDAGTGSPDFPNAEVWDTLELDCGFTVCKKNYQIMKLDTPYFETFSLTEIPAGTCPGCPSCDCSGGGGGGGGVYVRCNEADCKEKYPCDECEDYEDVTPYSSCKSCCDEEVCKDTVCDFVACDPCDECVQEPCNCPEPEGQNIGAIIIAILGGVLAGGAGGVYFTRNKVLGKNGGIKVYMGLDGKEKMLHKHPGIVGYHDPETQHRDIIERHPKGQVFPHYEKIDNVWHYVK